MTPALAAVLALLLSIAAAAQTAAPDTEWFAPDDTARRVLVYRSHPLDGGHDAITRALVLIPAGGRGAARTFALGREIARRAGADGDTLVLAPRFPSNDDYVCMDTLDEREVNWGCQANRGWQAGGPAVDRADLTTFDVVDRLLQRLASKTAFPRLREIVIAGHSAGGQFVTRYSLTTTVDPLPGVTMSYAVANPASYAWPDGARPVSGDPAAGCRIYDDWPYGLRDRQGYASRLSEDELRRHLAGRRVTYLLGALDNVPNAGFDASCPAMAQGPSRLDRGRAFARHVNDAYRARHAVVVVPGCGHDERCMFSAPAAARVLFPAR